MSRWIERILHEFPADIARLWIAADPDDVLLDERIISSLRERGFELLPFEDSIAFRVEYEERYRAAWDRGEAGPSHSLIVHFRGTDVDALPWDYLRSGRRASLSLADLFPNLSSTVVRQIGSEHFEKLFDEQSRQSPQPMGESATKEFILARIFKISPYAINQAEDLWRELLRLHYRSDGLPQPLADHVAAALASNAAFAGLPIAELFASKSFLLHTLQSSWVRFVTLKDASGTPASNASVPEATPGLAIPFDHHDVRGIVTSMFHDGTLRPVTVRSRPTSLPEWARIGVVDDPYAMLRLVKEGVAQLASVLPGPDANHRDWAQWARRLGEVTCRHQSLPSTQAGEVGVQLSEVWNEADVRFRAWVTAHYDDLPSLPVAKSPVMVHHVPRFLAMRRDAGESRVALLVFDGMAMDQWVQIRELLAKQVPEIGFEEGACVAWLPTLTSVSRQALFSGLKPREFASSIDTTTNEPKLWSSFWQSHGLRANEIAYRKGIKRPEDLAELETALSDPRCSAIGIVVDMIDEMVHGDRLGKRGIAGQIATWCETGFVEHLLRTLLDKGFHIYLTADHGNMEALGIGRINEGATVETRGARVRVYRSQALVPSMPEDIDAFRLDSAGLPADFLPLFAGGRGAFVQKDQPTVAHGGLSIEELVVPFVKVTRGSMGQ